MPELKAPAILYNNLTVYERTFIETFQSLVNSGNYAPGPLVLAIARDATAALMTELGFAVPRAGVDYVQGIPEFTVWKNPNNPQNQ